MASRVNRCYLASYRVKVKVNFSLEQTRKNYRGSRGIALHFFNLGARCRWVVNATLRALYPRDRPSTHCTGGWVGPRAGLGGSGKYNWDSIPGPSNS